MAIERGVAVTPHDTDRIDPTKALWVGGAGNVAVELVGDDASVTLVGVDAGTLLPVAAVKVLATGTTATDIVALR